MINKQFLQICLNLYGTRRRVALLFIRPTLAAEDRNTTELYRVATGSNVVVQPHHATRLRQEC